MPISKEAFRTALGRFASGVTVVTSIDADGRFHGMTVSAFCSVSLAPPLILISVSKETGSHRAIMETEKFAVNILSEGQAQVSDLFAAPVEDKFSRTEYIDGEYGLPLLAGALVNLECALRHAYDGGDHTIYVGLIERSIVADGKPLVHFMGGYCSTGN